jgi:peptidoglycan/LPS O-acetylase OafA/YrhL
MKSQNIGYIPQIDHLRLLAAMLVFGFHYFHYYAGGWQPFPQHPWFGLLTEGHTGVSLFFVLSGFIFMTIALSGGEIRYRTFLRNRVLRIAPLFLVVFVVAVSVGRDRFEVSDLLYLLVTNIGDPPTSWHFITGPSWSISIEFAFYLVFPFLALFVREHGSAYLVKLVAMLLVVKIAGYLATENSTHMLYSTLIGRFDQFLIGMLAAIAFRSNADRLRRAGYASLGLAVALVVLMIGLQASFASYYAGPKQPFWIVWGTIEAALWAVFVVAYLSARLPWPVWIDRALRGGGVRSFSIYMWHALIIFAAHEFFGQIGGPGLLTLAFNGVLVLAATLAFAHLSYEAIERPFLHMRRRYTEAGFATKESETPRSLAE